MRNGAYDFITKPFDPGSLVTSVREAIRATAQKRPEEVSEGESPLTFPGRELLTPRECDVLDLIANGASNKEAGRKLGISPRTVEVHRARIMDKMHARSLSELVRMALAAGIRPV